jgi:acyl-coenzyme A thioesterase PaaI-like protein
MSMTVISTTAAMCMAVRWRRSPMIWAEEWPGSTSRLRFGQTTIESKTNIFRACVPGRLTGVAVPVHVGRRMIVLQTSIYRLDGKLAAMMIQTQMVLPQGSAIPADEGGGKA